jgi:hypothetical protein
MFDEIKKEFLELLEELIKDAESLGCAESNFDRVGSAHARRDINITKEQIILLFERLGK